MNVSSGTNKKIDVLDEKIDRLISVVATKDELRGVGEQISELESNIDRLVTSIASPPSYILPVPI